MVLIAKVTMANIVPGMPLQLLLMLLGNICTYGCAVLSHSVVSDSLLPHGLWPATHFCPWDSPGKNTGVGCHALFQGIFPTQASNPDFSHYRQILYCLSHQGSPSAPKAYLYTPFFKKQILISFIPNLWILF